MAMRCTTAQIVHGMLNCRAPKSQVISQRRAQLQAALPIAIAQDSTQRTAIAADIQAQLRECEASSSALPPALMLWIDDSFDAEGFKDVDARRQLTAVISEMRE